MDEARRQALAAELEAALNERAQLDVVITYLRDRLGLPGDAVVESTASQLADTVQATGDPESTVAPGEFFKMSGPHASKTLLERFGRTRPLRTEEIFAAIVKGGVKIQNQQGLYRSLFRDPRFTRVGRSTWGLTEWYPDRIQKRDQEPPARPSESPTNGEPQLRALAAATDDASNPSDQLAHGSEG